MKAGQWVYYICKQIDAAYGFWGGDNFCNLPNRGFFRIKDSPYVLMLSRCN